MIALTPTEQAGKPAAAERFSACCLEHDLQLPSAYFDVLYPIACWMKNRVAQSKSRRIMSCCGAQGSGKTTFVALLADQLEYLGGISSLVVSLDDFYLTRQERIELGTSVNPLLRTRGVPGTHDVGLMHAVRAAYLAGEVASVPRFDKSTDDRSGEESFPTATVDLLVFEGWCWGVSPVAERELLAPVNALETEEDPGCAWRRYVNRSIKDYQEVFAADDSLFLAVPDFEAVLRWRWQQEQTLPDGPGKMSFEEIERFIMYYERLTRRLLQQYPAVADICIRLNEDHSFGEVLGPPDAAI